MNVIVINKNEPFRESVKFYLEDFLSIKVFKTLTSMNDISEIEDIQKADIIIMELEASNVEGIVAVKKALKRNRFLKLLAIANYCEKDIIAELIEAGLRGCVLKSNFFKEIEIAIEAIQNNQLYFPYNKSLLIDHIY